MDKREEELQLIRDIKEGNRDGYRILVDRYAPMIFKVVNRFVDHNDDAEELAQQIFVKTYERLSSFKGDSKFSSWLYMIAMNHCRDYARNVRRQNSRFSEMDDQKLDRHLENHDSPDHEIERQEWLELLQEGLDHIAEDYAEAFLLKYENNMTYKAMAKRLDASVSALKVRVYRAKKELKTFIEQRS
ncbi:MAG TPA: sigma-70 family RNA polymerase sigma factor [Balneolaceae bacterium]|nr:sigma-70 family RNA polymerase sigma factor [Balneolaceae bacterium]